MKREIVAGALLLSLLFLSFWNVRYIEEKTGELSFLVSQAETLYQEGQRQAAAERAQESLDNWLNWGTYSHIMMRHGEIDQVTDAYFTLLDELEGDDPVTRASFRAVLEKLSDIITKERISLGALF